MHGMAWIAVWRGCFLHDAPHEPGGVSLPCVQPFLVMVRLKTALLIRGVVPPSAPSAPSLTIINERQHEPSPTFDFKCEFSCNYQNSLPSLHRHQQDYTTCLIETPTSCSISLHTGDPIQPGRRSTTSIEVLQHGSYRAIPIGTHGFDVVYGYTIPLLCDVGQRRSQPHHCPATSLPPASPYRPRSRLCTPSPSASHLISFKFVMNATIGLTLEKTIHNLKGPRLSISRGHQHIHIHTHYHRHPLGQHLRRLR
eukprot:TRINITY_DN9856_c0_g1_i2.p1 TRINITY_DN9856_c0_g1~~TRINITY_DN9856_c0_g1_i2.p1  ORF type:complete len:253 (-),score=16.66 TRINITY_DN9856_c0_g1_i2:996-1754(-)